MSKSLSAKYYLQNKERLQEKLVKDIKILPKKKTKRSGIIKISQKMKKKLVECRKR